MRFSSGGGILGTGLFGKRFIKNVAESVSVGKFYHSNKKSADYLLSYWPGSCVTECGIL